LQPSFHDLTLVSVALDHGGCKLVFGNPGISSLHLDNTSGVWSAGVVMPLVVSGAYFLSEKDFSARIESFLDASEKVAFQEHQKLFPKATHLLILVPNFGSPLILLIRGQV